MKCGGQIRRVGGGKSDMIWQKQWWWEDTMPCCPPRASGLALSAGQEPKTGNRTQENLVSLSTQMMGYFHMLLWYSR